MPPSLKPEFDDVITYHASEAIAPWCQSMIDACGGLLTQDVETRRLLDRWLALCLAPAPELALSGQELHAQLRDQDWRHSIARGLESGLIRPQQLGAEFRSLARDSWRVGLERVWHMDASTIYRILRSARAMETRVLNSIGGERVKFTSLLWQFASHYMRQRLGANAGQHAAWHCAQADRFEASGRPDTMLWHLYLGGAWDELGPRLHLHVSEFQDATRLRREIEWLIPRAPKLSQQARLHRVLAWLSADDGQPDARRAELEMAARLARRSGDPLALGGALHELAAFLDGREPDRADGLYRSSIEALESSLDHDAVIEEYAYTLIDYSLSQARRYSGAAIGILRRADRLALAPHSQARANLLFCKGILSNRVGDPAGALQHFSLAAAIYTVLNDPVNLSLLQVSIAASLLRLGRAAEALRALDQALEAGSAVRVHNSDLARILNTRSRCLLQLGQPQAALEVLQRAHTHADRAGDMATMALVFDGLARVYRVLHHNTGLEVHLSQHCFFRDSLGMLAEHYADARVHQTRLKDWLEQGSFAESQDPNPVRLLEPERATHFSELGEIDRLRLSTAVETAPETRISAHLAIARQYLELSIKERQMALALANQHGRIGDTTEATLAMAERHNQSMNPQDVLISRWQAESGLGAEQIRILLAHFAISRQLKSRECMRLLRISAATATRLLTRLCAANLLRKHGGGRATRYTLGLDGVG